MPSLLYLVGIGAVLGIAPLILGFVPAFLMGRPKSWIQFSAGVALGFLSLFFTELIDDSGFLGVSSGLPLTRDQIVLATLFVLGFLFLLILSVKGPLVKSDGSRFSAVLLVYLVAMGMGFHSFGEGMIVGNSFASQVPIWELSSIFQGLSFSIHKFLEGFTIALFFEPQPRLKTALICTVLTSLPFLAGVPLGLSTYPNIFANLFFAAGAGAVIFMIIKLVPMLDTKRINYATVFGFAVGFLIIYLSTLIHYTTMFY